MVHVKRVGEWNALVQFLEDSAKEGNHAHIVGHNDLETIAQNAPIHGSPNKKEFRQNISSLVPLLHCRANQFAPHVLIEAAGVRPTGWKAEFQKLGDKVKRRGTLRSHEETAIEE